MERKFSKRPGRLAAFIAIVALAFTPLVSGAQTTTQDQTTNNTNTTPNQTQQSSVSMVDNAFEPASLTVPVGTIVTWTNNGAHNHTVTADDGSFDSSNIPPTGTFTYTFNSAGTYHYYCKLHGAPNGVGMAGVIFVTDSSSSSSNGTASSSTSTDVSNITSTSTTATSTEATTTASSTLDTIAPSVPTDLLATPISSSQINLTWTAATDTVGTSGYVVFRDGAQVATTSMVSYNDTGLTASTTYSYMVSSYDAAGNGSVASPSVSATTLAASGGTSTSTPATSTMPTMPMMPSLNTNVYGWIIIPASLFDQIMGTQSSSPSTPWWDTSLMVQGSSSSSTMMGMNPYTMNNGYPTINGNYVDCNGNIDNDMGHHTTNPSDTDPAHHIGQNCPGGMPQMSQNNMSGMWDMTHQGTMMPFMLNWYSGSGQTVPMVVIPLTDDTLHKLHDYWSMHTTAP